MLKNLTNAEAPAALVGAIIASYGATSCTIDKGAFLRLKTAYLRAGGALDGNDGFTVAAGGERYYFYFTTFSRSRQRGGDFESYRMEQE